MSSSSRVDDDVAAANVQLQHSGHHSCHHDTEDRRQQLHPVTHYRSNNVASSVADQAPIDESSFPPSSSFSLQQNQKQQYQIPSIHQQQEPQQQQQEEPPQRRNHQQQHNSKRVLVIGAGISGLACARELVHRGHQVLVVEARGRLGGRLKSAELLIQKNNKKNNKAPTATVASTNTSRSSCETATTTRTTPTKQLRTTGTSNKDTTLRSPKGIQQQYQKNSIKSNQSFSSKSPQSTALAGLAATLNAATTTALTATIASSTTADTETTTTQLVDIGGALIHGIDQNPLYVLTSEQMGIPTRSVQECLLMDDSGWPVDPKDDEKIATLFNECLEESFRRIQDPNYLGPRRSRSSTTSSSSTTTTAAVSFGTLFEQVCQEKMVHPTALLKWHQANLEISCGASFHHLGWQWNDDEPYGFEGDHVALPTSWGTVMNTLAHGLNIMFHSPIQSIHIVYATASSTTATTPNKVSNNNQSDDKDDIDHHHANNRRETRSSSKVTTETKSIISSSTTGLNRLSTVSASSNNSLVAVRHSRRLKGEDANTRRSERSTKGTPVDRFTIPREIAKSQSPSKGRRRGHNGKDDFNNVYKNGKIDVKPPKTIVQVTLTDGTILEADAVVCTLPLGILKLTSIGRDKNNNNNNNGAVTFHPQLPMDKQQAIARLGTGLLNKCALSFPHVFWQDSDFLGLAQSDHSYLVLNVAHYTGQPILIFMYGGSFAKEVEDWTDQEIVQDCLAVLRKICGRQIPDLLDYHATRWGNEQYSRMAFTYIPPGVDGFRELQALSRPVCDPNNNFPVLMFAGEHTTPYHPSTIHGALLSGIREAYRFDSFVDPDANDDLVFSDEQIYVPTFSVERIVSGQLNSGLTPSKSTEKVTNPIRQQHRRRGTAYVMNLRKRPKSTKKDESSSNKKLRSSNEDSPMPTPTRRSHRSLASPNGHSRDMPSPSSDPNDKHLNGQVPKPHDVVSLENRILFRGIESYGGDFQYIYDVSIPVHVRGGNETNSTGDHHSSIPVGLLRRCHKVSRAIHQQKKKYDPKRSIWKSWVAKMAYPLQDGRPSKK